MPAPAYATAGEAVVARLKASAALTALVGTRVYPSMPTQDPAGGGDWPFVVYYRTAGGGSNNLRGRTRLQAYTFRVDVYAKSEASGEACLKAVVAALAGWSDRANGVDHVTAVDDADTQVTDKAERVPGQSFSVWFKG